MQSVVGVAMVPEAILEKLEPMLKLAKNFMSINHHGYVQEHVLSTILCCIPPPSQSATAD